MQIDNCPRHRNEPDLKKSNNLSVKSNNSQVRHSSAEEAEICLRPTQSQPEDHLQRKLQIRGPGKISCQPSCYRSATSGRILEVKQTLKT